MRGETAPPSSFASASNNLGDIVIEGDDILGDGVNVAARLESQAPKNGILVSDAVHAQCGGKSGSISSTRARSC